MNQKVSDLPYFKDTDFTPYLKKQFDYLSYVGPRGSNDDHGRYLAELEEYVLIEIKPHILVMEHEGSFESFATEDAETKTKRKYIDHMLVPISQIVEFRVSMYNEPIADT